MSSQQKIPELYKAEDIKREADELNRMARLRASVKKLRKLNVLPFVLALPLSAALVSFIYLVLSILPNEPYFSHQPLSAWALVSLCLYPIVQSTLHNTVFEGRRYDEIELLRRLFLRDHGYWDALKRMDKECPSVAKKIRRMRYVTGELAD
ncbi:MAG: hypothetical protein WC750_02380 [Patescibacteria group bacterium]|jgi:hypothetical protein